MLRVASFLYICSNFFAAVSPAATPDTGASAPTFTSTFPQNVSAGQDLLISWVGGTTLFNLILDIKTKPETLIDIASNLTANSFLWHVPVSMPNDFFYVAVNDTTGHSSNTDRLTLVNQASASTSSSSQSSGTTEASIPPSASTPTSILQTLANQAETSTASLVVQSASPSATSAPASLPAQTTTTAVSPSSLGTSSIHANPTSSPSPSPSPSQASSTTPAAARIGMGIGISLGVVAFIGLLALFFHFGKSYASRTTISKTYNFEKPELETGEVMKTMPRLPSIGKGPYELDGKSRSIRRAELG